MLEPTGCRLVTARSGDEALRALLRDDFAVILLDVQMPGLDGFETAELIRARERSRSVPIIFVTAISKEPHNVFRGYETGAVDYLFKPLDAVVLRSKVEVFVELWQSKEQLKHQADQLHQAQLDALHRASEERYRALIEAMPQQVWTARPTGDLDYAERPLRRLLRRRGGAPAGGWLDRRDPPGGRRPRWSSAGAPRCRRARRTRSTSACAAPTAYYRWHLGRAVAVRDEAGEIVSWLGTNTDVDDQRRAEEAQRFLLAAGSLLGGSLEVERTLDEAVELVVSRLGDWCALFMRDDGSVVPFAVQHRDPTARPPRAGRSVRGRHPTPPLARVLSQRAGSSSNRSARSRLRTSRRGSGSCARSGCTT